MINLVDIEKGLYSVAYKKRRHLIIFVIATILTIGIVLILMLTSKQKYVLELIFTILFSVSYLLYLVFYFTVIKRLINAELRFYEGARNAKLNEVYCSINSISKDVKEYNLRDYYVLEAKVEDNLKEEDKIFYVPKKFEFKKNQKAILHCFGSIVIKVEFRK